MKLQARVARLEQRAGICSVVDRLTADVLRRILDGEPVQFTRRLEAQIQDGLKGRRIGGEMRRLSQLRARVERLDQQCLNCLTSATRIYRSQRRSLDHHREWALRTSPDLS